MESLSGFIEERIGVRAKVKKAAPSKVVTLSDATFNKTVLDPDVNVFVKYYAPWCGHCKNLAPIWEEVAKVFDNDKDVVMPQTLKLMPGCDCENRC